MKTLNHLLLIMLLLLFSCTPNENDLDATNQDLVTINNNAKSWVDPQTPKSVQPHFNQYYSKDGTNTPDLNTAIYPNTEWECVWSDEFETYSLDASKWIKSNENDRGIGAQRAANGVTRWYWDQDNVRFDGNNLVLDVFKPASGTLTGASVETKGLHEFKYGYYEVSVRIAETTKGTHTAFWLQADSQANPQPINFDDSGRDGAEIDIFESTYTSNKVQVAIHYDGYGNDKGNHTIEYSTPNIHDGNFKKFGMHWKKDAINIYYQGDLANSLNTPNKDFPISTSFTDGHPVVPEVPEWLWLSTGAAFKPNNFASQPVSTTDSISNAKFGYVRVFKLKPLENTNFQIVNKQTNSWIKTFGSSNGSAIKQATSGTGNWTKWNVQKIAGTNFYYIVNQGTSKYIKPNGSTNNSTLRLEPNTSGGSWTQWEFIDEDSDGYFYIKNKQTGKFLRPDSAGHNVDLVIANKQETDWFKWKLQ